MIGIIGGSGLEDPKLLKDFEERKVKTKFGEPSSAVTIGKINGVEVAILSRHGKKHNIMPTKVPFRANIWALKELGVKHLVVSTACGSLREEIEPGHLVFPSQLIDHTKHRLQTFYDEEEVCHVSMAEPFCARLRKILADAAQEMKLSHHINKTTITIEGPRFSTKAESHMFRQWGADIINMSTSPEAVLAREAGMCYQPIAMATDYDCWMEEKEAVTIDAVLKIFKQNAENVKKLLVNAVPKIKYAECECMHHIDTAVLK